MDDQVTIVDIGASLCDGPPRFKSLITHWPARVVAFEPQAMEAHRIREAYPWWDVRMTALGSGKPETLNACRWSGCSSIYEPDPEVINEFHSIGTGDEGSAGDNFQVVDRVEIQTATLDSQELGQVDLLKIDAQGAEVEILAHAERTMARTSVIELEFMVLPFYRGAPTLSDVLVFMEARGFGLHRIINMVSMPMKGMPEQRSGQAVWGDAVFIRGDLMDEGKAVQRRAGIVLESVYQSTGMASRLCPDLYSHMISVGAAA